jgi:hypothetical protein
MGYTPNLPVLATFMSGCKPWRSRNFRTFLVRLIANLVKIDGVTREVQWPGFDIEIIRQDEPSSWFRRLYQVATTLVCQWVLINCNKLIPGGVTLELNDNTIRALLLHVPTPPTRDNVYSPFEIEDWPLQDWVEAFKSIDDESEPAMPSIRMTELWDLQDAMEVQVEDRPSLAESKLDHVIQESQSSEKVAAERIRAALAIFPSPPLAVVDNTISAKPSQSDLAPMYTPNLTAMDLALVLGNTKTKVAIALALASEEIQAWDLLASECAERVSEWTAQKKALEHQHALLQRCHSSAASFNDSAMVPLVGETNVLQSAIDAAKMNRSVARFLDRKLKSGPSTSPIIPPSFRSTTPSSSSPVPGLSSKRDQHYNQPSPPSSGAQLQDIVGGRPPHMPVSARAISDPVHFLQPPIALKGKHKDNEESEDEIVEIDDGSDDEKSVSHSGRASPSIVAT